MQFVARQDRDDVPADLERLLDGAVLVFALGQELLLERLAELQVLLVERAQFLLADDVGQARAPA